MSKKPLFCDDCGTRNTPDSKYCKECGSQIHAAYQTLALSAYDHMDDSVQQERLTQFLDMAFWHTEAGNTDAALRACGAALALNPNSTTAHSLLGSLHEAQGDDALAIQHFERVLALNPDSEADRVKLAQLQEGVHAAPIRPSPVYRWLPPAFATARFSTFALSARERWAGLRRPKLTLLPSKPTPALIAGATAILVLAGCLFLVHPGTQAGATVSPPAHPGPMSSASAHAMPPIPALPAPIVLPATPGTPLPAPAPTPSVVAVLPRNDPFASTSSSPFRPSGAFLPLPTSASPRPFRPRVRTVRREGLRPLPALSLVALPTVGQGPLQPIQPAPVQVPSSWGTPPSSEDGIARHTVVIRRLDASRAVESGDGVSAAPAPSPHIEITIDRSSAPSAADSADGGEGYQQSAFALQQQGNYRQAQAVYEKAVRAYQAQMASGRDSDAAARGLQACKTGLQICQQNQ